MTLYCSPRTCEETPVLSSTSFKHSQSRAVKWCQIISRNLIAYKANWSLWWENRNVLWFSIGDCDSATARVYKKDRFYLFNTAPDPRVLRFCTVALLKSTGLMLNGNKWRGVGQKIFTRRIRSRLVVDGSYWGGIRKDLEIRPLRWVQNNRVVVLSRDLRDLRRSRFGAARGNFV